MDDAVWADHECVYPEVVIDSAPDGDLLKEGMPVLLPCPTCGETPFDHVKWMERELADMTAAVVGAAPSRSLFHWAPAARRKQIQRYGLRPRSRSTTSTGLRTPMVCFADSPSWAWALSGNMSWTPNGWWDLWETTMDALEDPIIRPTSDRVSGIYEVRTEHRVFKRDLWFVSSRLKDA